MREIKWVRTVDAFPEEGKIVMVRSMHLPKVLHIGSFDSSYFHYVLPGSSDNDLSGEYCKKYVWDYWAEIPEFSNDVKVVWIHSSDSSPDDGDSVWAWVENSPVKAFFDKGHFIESIDYGEGKELLPVDYWSPRRHFHRESAPKNSPYDEN